jgi:hypothetical protein
LVARIAYNILEQESPETIQGVENILKSLETSGSTWTTGEKDHPFVECVTFADNIKNKGGSYQSNWHFVDTPYYDE